MARDGDTASVPRSVPVSIIDHVTLSAARWVRSVWAVGMVRTACFSRVACFGGVVRSKRLRDMAKTWSWLKHFESRWGHHSEIQGFPGFLAQFHDGARDLGNPQNARNDPAEWK